MNVLFLTSHLPFPPLSGGRLREYELLRRLGTRHHIEICAVSRTLGYDQANLESVRAFAKVYLFGSPTLSGGDTGSDASFLVRNNASPEATAFVSSRLVRGDIDLVHCEGFYMRPLVGEARVPIFLMEQNIEYRVWPDQSERVHAEEREAWRSSTRCGVVTEEDGAILQKEIDPLRVLLSFNGSDHTTEFDQATHCVPSQIPQEPIVLTVGNFAYAPSYEAGQMMCTSIGPEVLNLFDEATVLLVGNAAERLAPFASHSRIALHDRVRSLEPYYAAATVVACPLNSGGGIKVKILEALFRGCAIVTSDIGRQGLRDAPLVVADTPRAFVSELARLISDRSAREELRERASRFAVTLPTWDAAAQRLEECWKEVNRVGADPTMTPAWRDI